MSRIASAALVCALIALTGCTSVWVSPLGNDSNPGTQTSPKRSFAGACAVPRDAQGRLVHVEGGTYPQQVIPAGCDRTLFVQDGQATLRATGDASGPDYPATLQVEAPDVEVRNIALDSAGFKRKAAHVSAPRVRFVGMDIGDTTNEKAIEVTAPDFWLMDSTVHDAAITDPDAHLECLFAHEAERLHLLNNTWRGCAVYDVALTRCTWCSPVPPVWGGAVIEGNDFGHSVQLGGNWHYTELAFYAALGEVRNATVRNNHFETRSDGRGGVLLELPWGGVRCGNTEGPVQGVIGSDWKEPCP